MYLERKHISFKSTKRQSETTEFALPGAATWRTGRDIRILFDSGPFALLCENMTLFTKKGVNNVLRYDAIQYIYLRSKADEMTSLI